MIIAITPLAVCIIGLLIYVLSNATTQPGAKVTEIGRIMFWTGLLAFLLGGGVSKVFGG